MTRHVKSMFFAAISVFLLWGCAGEKIVKEVPIQELKAPEWVIKGSGAFSSDKGKVFYGVGVVSNVKNTALLRTTADNRARAELAKTFEVYTASLMKDYMAATTAGEKGVSSEEQHIEQAIKTVTAMTLSGVEIIDHWQNPGNMDFYSLAQLDLNAFMDTLDKSKELSKEAKEYIRDNAAKLHDELEKEEEKKEIREGQ